MPDHIGDSNKKFDALTVIMHAREDGYWHAGAGNVGGRPYLINNMMWKYGKTCGISTVPAGVYPVDIALGLAEIKKPLTKEDLVIKYSILLDQGEMDQSVKDSLRPQIKTECEGLKINQVEEHEITEAEANILAKGGPVTIGPYPTGKCTVQTSVIYTGTGCWYWPNSGTGEHVSIHNIVSPVAQLSC